MKTDLEIKALPFDFIKAFWSLSDDGIKQLEDAFTIWQKRTRMKTAEKMLNRGSGNFINCTDYDDAIKAMEEFGRQCFEAGRKTKKSKYPFSPLKYTDFNHYLTTLKDGK